MTPLELVPALSMAVTVPLKVSPSIESIVTDAFCPIETDSISLSSTETDMDMVSSGLMLIYCSSEDEAELLSDVSLSAAFMTFTVPESVEYSAPSLYIRMSCWSVSSFSSRCERSD